MLMKKLAVFFLIFLPSICTAGTVIDGVRTWPAPNNTRLVFDIDQPVDYKLFTLSKPERLVIDFKNTRLTKPLSAPAQQATIIKEIRSSQRNKNDLRVVIDLYHEASSAEQKVFKKSVPERPVGLRDIVIAIDAGHGGEDPGAHGRHGTTEKDVVLSIAR